MRKSTTLFIALLVTLVGLKASAEYRAFRLRISKRNDSQVFRLVTSSLDPLQYPRYFTINQDEMVTYDDTWMCKGFTGDGTPYCPSPHVQNETSEGPEKGP